MALGALGYQSGCLPKQPLRFIINTVSYEAVFCTHSSSHAREAAGLGWSWTGRGWGGDVEAQSLTVSPTHMHGAYSGLWVQSP